MNADKLPIEIRIIEHLAQLEEDIHLYSFEIVGFSIWAIIKESIATSDGIYSSKSKNILNISKYIIACFYNEIKFELSRSLKQNHNILFILNGNSSFKVNSKLYQNAFWDDIIILLRSNYNPITIEYNKGKKSKKYQEYKVNFTEYFTKNPFNIIGYFYDYRSRKLIIKIIDEIFQYYTKHYVNTKDTEVYENVKSVLNSKYLRYKIFSFIKEKAKAKRIFNKYNIQCVFLTSAQGHYGVIAAAKELEIKIIEYQHGIINSKHPVYYFNKGIVKKKIPVPDYILLMGEYWKNVLLESGFWLDSNLIIIGKKNIEPSKINDTNYSIDNRNVSIIFSSQPNLANRTIGFIQTLVYEYLVKDTNVRLYIRYHPRETKNKIYETLSESFPNSVFICSSDENIGSMMQKYQFHITSHSALLYETIYYGMPSFTISAEGEYYFSDLIKRGLTIFFDNPFKLVSHIRGYLNNFEDFTIHNNNPNKIINTLYSNFNPLVIKKLFQKYDSKK